MCWSLGMNSQSKQHMVSPVRNRVPLAPSRSFTLQARTVIECMILDTSQQVIQPAGQSSHCMHDT